MKELQGDCKNDISSHASLLSNDEAISLPDRNGGAESEKRNTFGCAPLLLALTRGLALTITARNITHCAASVA